MIRVKGDIILIDNFNHDELKNINNLVFVLLPTDREMCLMALNHFMIFYQIQKQSFSPSLWVFALGDMTYAETFCFGGKKFDSALSQLNAQKVIETFVTIQVMGVYLKSMHLIGLKAF